MAGGLGDGGPVREHSSRDAFHPRRCRTALCHPLWRTPMTWQTPTAVDFRFGFEITMYVAAR